MRRGIERYVRDLARKADRLTVPGVPPSLAEFVGRPVEFMQALVDPDSGQPFVLYRAQRRFLTEAFVPTADGSLPYPELLYSAPKKSGKTTLAAVCVLYVVRVLGGRYAEGYCVANDFDQAQARVFTACAKIIEVSPLLERTAKILKDRIEFPDTKAFIQALPADYAGAAGSNPSIVVFDELWGYISESARRLWDELVPVPTRKVSVRLTVTYAGFEGESALLEELHKRGHEGEQIGPSLYRLDGMLMFWSGELVAPWQSQAWIAQMREQLRPSAFTRMILNKFTAGESEFVPLEWWDQCVDAELRPVVGDRALPLFVGVDASVKRDATAIVAVTWDHDSKRVRLVTHRIFQPSPKEPLDFEATVERTLLEFSRAFRVQAVRYDPYQLVSSAQRLSRAGLPMQEFPQSVPNLTEASQTLYDLVKGRNVTPSTRTRRCVGLWGIVWPWRTREGGASRNRRPLIGSTSWWRWQWRPWCACRRGSGQW